MKKSILFGIFASLVSCQNASVNKVAQKKIIKTETTLISNDNCGFEKFLNDSKTPKLAKELFKNKAKNNDAVLEYFGKLNSSDQNERNFYFKVITNSYKVADGSTSEGLGYSGLNYVEKNTLDFLNYFDKEECFSENDLETWAKIAMLEFSLVHENEGNNNITKAFILKIDQNCKNCNSSQKETLNKFSNYLTKEWEAFLSKQ